MVSPQDQNSSSKTRREVTEKVINFLKRFIKDYSEAASKYKPGGKMDFHNFINEELGFDFRLQIGKWRKIDEANMPRTIDLVKILATNKYLRDNNLSTLNIASLLLDKDILNTDILEKYNNIPESYKQKAKKYIEDQIILQHKISYNELRYTTKKFREQINNIIVNKLDRTHKIKALHDMISIIFRWYVSTFNKDRAILYLKAEYWNGAHIKLKFNRSRTTREFISRSNEGYEKNRHNKDIDWYIDEYPLELLPEDILNILTKKEFEEIRSLKLAASKKVPEHLQNKIQELKTKLSQGYNWASQPKYLEQGKMLDASEDIWNDRDNKQSLAYNTIYQRKKIAANYFTKEDYLRGGLDENKDNYSDTETDKSGYSIPLFSPDQRSIIGNIMIVSSDADAFTEESFDKYKKSVSNHTYFKDSNNSNIKNNNALSLECEYFIIDEIEDLVRDCLNTIYQTSGNIYNLITTLEPNKYFPEIVFDIWYHNSQINALLDEMLDQDNEEGKRSDFDLIKKALPNAFDRYTELTNLHDPLGNKSSINKFNAIYKQAFSDYGADINTRFATAVKMCSKKLENFKKNNSMTKAYTLKDMFQVRLEIEETCLNLAQKSFQSSREVISPKIYSEYLLPLYKQAKAINDFIKILTPLLKNNNTIEKEIAAEHIDEFLKSIKHLQEVKKHSKSINKFEDIYREVIIVSISGNKEQLKNLIYRLHAHFHITLHLLSTMELLPYAGMFAILATSNPDSVDLEDYNSAQSHLEHEDILRQLDISYSSPQHNKTAGNDARKHIESILKRIKQSNPESLNKLLPQTWIL